MNEFLEYIIASKQLQLATATGYEKQRLEIEISIAEAMKKDLT